MDNTTVFSKTGKGLLEVKNRSNRITKEQYRVLSLVDGKANLDDLADRARMNANALRQILTQLSDSGYIKVLVSSSTDSGLGAGAITGSYYVDDLDFTGVLAPSAPKRPSVYQSTETERRQRESAERKAAEAAATKRREEEERRKLEEAARKAKEDEVARRVREEAERKGQQEAQRQAKLESELKARLDAEKRAKEDAAQRARAEVEVKLKEEIDRQIRAAAEQKRKEDAVRAAAEAEAKRKAAEQQRQLEAARLEQERKHREEEERRKKEEEERQRKAEEERKLKEEEERKRKDEEERKRREAEERLRREEEERRKKAEEERKRKEEEERKRREEEERIRREEEERRKKAEEERKRKEEEERKRREEEERLRREEEERRKKAEEERKRKEEEERKRREEEERLRREEEERRKKAEEERKRKEGQERKRREEEERLRRAEEARRKKEMEHRRREEEEARKRREDEERLRRGEEERRLTEAQERRLKEEEELKVREEVERARREEDRGRQEAEERWRNEAEDRKRQEAEVLGRADAEQAEREAAAEEQRLQDEVKKRKADKERRRREFTGNDEDRQGLRDGDLASGVAKSDDKWLLDELARLNAEDLARQGRHPETTPAPADDARRTNVLTDRPGRTVAPTGTEEKNSYATESVTVQPVENEVALAAELHLSEAEFGELEGLAVPEVIEEVVAEEAPFSGKAVASAAVPGVTEEDIRRALEEQERRWRMEEEARAALERAEFEAQIKAEREAREIAEAAAQARREAELHAREEAERLRREERERRELEEEERRKQKEAERRAREQARQEAERRKREDDLIKQRKELEERELRKIERDRIQKEVRRAQITPLRAAAGLVVIVAVLAGLIVQFASLSPWAPDIERVASYRIGEPVHITSVRGSLFPIRIVLEGVTAGSAQDVRATVITITPQLGTLLSANKVLDSIEIKGATIGPEGLRRVSQWLNGPSAKPDVVDVSKVRIKDSTLNLPGVALKNIDADIKLGRSGELLGITATTVDEHLRIELLPRGDDMEVTISGRNFTMPVGPSLEVMDLQGSGRISGNELHLSRLEYFAYGGQGTAEMHVRWKDQWSVESTFDFQRISLDSAMRALAIQVVSDGALDAKGMLRLRSSNFDDLFKQPEIDATFVAKRGNLAGYDIPRALQQRHRDGVQGGKTRFEELQGAVAAKEGRYQYRQVKLTAGILKATGQVDISPDGDVAGRLSAELRSSAGLVRGNFSVSGNDQATLLKP